MPSISSGNDRQCRRNGVRYLVGAVVCSLINTLVLIGVDALGGPLISGVLLSWIAGGTTGFVWHSRITYDVSLSFSAFLRFLGGALLGIPMAWLVLWTLTQPFGLPVWLASPVATAVLFFYHYANAFLAIRWVKALALVRSVF